MTAPQPPQPYSNEEIPALVKSLTEASARDTALSGAADDPMKAGGFLGRAIQNARLAASLEELGRLREALQQREQDTARLLTFAARVTERVREGMDVDGGDVQDWATEAGLFIPTTVTAPCREYPGCACAGYGEWPMTCYRDSPQLAAARGVSSGPPAGDDKQKGEIGNV